MQIWKAVSVDADLEDVSVDAGLPWSVDSGLPWSADADLTCVCRCRFNQCLRMKI